MWREKYDSDAFLAKPDPLIAEWAWQQHGVVSIKQLRAAGLSRGAIALRVRNGRLHPIHRGVYAVGHARLTTTGKLRAAALAVPGAVISHRHAAYLHDLVPFPSQRQIELTTTSEHRSTPTLKVHRSRTLTAADRDEKHGLPVTSVAHTLVDLARVLPEHRYARLLDRAVHLRLFDLAAFPERKPPALRRQLERLCVSEPAVTRSELEEMFLALVADAGLPPPEVNQRPHGFEVDFLWPDLELVVEVDGAATHLNWTAFQEDRQRDVALQVAGLRVLRFTYLQVEAGAPVLAALRHFTASLAKSA